MFECSLKAIKRLSPPLLLKGVLAAVVYLVVWVLSIIAWAAIVGLALIVGGVVGEIVGVMLTFLFIAHWVTIYASLIKNYVLSPEDKDHLESIKKALLDSLDIKSLLFFLGVLAVGAALTLLWGAIAYLLLTYLPPLFFMALLVGVVIVIVFYVFWTYAVAYYKDRDLVELVKRAIEMVVKKWDDALGILGAWVAGQAIFHALVAWPVLIVKEYEEGCVSGDSKKTGEGQ
ncbi:MAG: hypothetical protein GXN92_02935 [Candidatus Micrarchaeota archaeon]|nr:hypothetical protein [Candidatus Micrarchaeota archaeon]